MGGVGNPHRRKITRPVAAGEPGGVPPIGLDAIARFGGHEGGGDDVAVDTKLGQLPVEHVAAGPSLVAGVKPMAGLDRKSTRLNSSHTVISYAVFCLKKKKK